MKTIRYMIAAATMSAALFMGCTKENSPERGLSDVAVNAKAINKIDGNATIFYQLQTLLPPSATIKWTSGNITASEDILNISRTEGNVIEKFTLTGDVRRTYDLFSDPVIGSVNVPYYRYTGIATTIELFSRSPNSDISLALNGVFRVNPGDAAIPVRVNIDQPLALNSIWISNVLVNSPVYTALITLDMSQVTNGITTTMFENAGLTNGTLVISSTSNPDLYAIIVNNFQDMTLNLQLNAPNTNLNALSAPAPVVTRLQ